MEKKQKLLIVEADDMRCRTWNDALSSLYEVRNAPTGKLALLQIPAYMPDLLIVNSTLPDMPGEDLCCTLKNDVTSGHIPVVLLLPFLEEQAIIRSLQKGVDAYLPISFSIEMLKATVANVLLNRARIRRKYFPGRMVDEDFDGMRGLHCANESDWNFIFSVKEKVERHLDSPDFNVDMLCTMMNMSRTSFYNRLKMLTDFSPIEYIRQIRLQQAASLLRKGHYSVTEVAEQVGFNDTKYFREVFKKEFGVPPSLFAKGEVNDE